MSSLTLVHGLLVGNFFMLMIVGVFMWSLRRQQISEQLRVHDKLSSLNEVNQAISKSAIGMGRRIKQLESRLQKAERKVLLPDGDVAAFEQASRLAGLGASATELVDSCGMARGEAELLVSLKRQ